MNAKEQLLECQRMHIRSLFKTLLSEIEGVKEDFDERYRLLQDQLGPEHLLMLYAANPLTNDRFMRIRKKILDVGNDVSRAMDSETERYNVTFVFKN